jgi:hypothetical protein
MGVRGSGPTHHPSPTNTHAAHPDAEIVVFATALKMGSILERICRREH